VTRLANGGVGKRRLVLFLSVLIVVVALLSWWVVFQIREGGAERARTEERLDHAANIAQTLLNEQREPVDPDAFLRRVFPGLIYVPGDGARGARDTRARPIVEGEVVPDTAQMTAVDARSRRLVRMFLAEGAFFVLLQIVGIAIVLGAVRREVRLRRQQENFLSAVTHELKSPLTSIGLFAETLRRSELPVERRVEILEKIGKDVRRLETLMNNLLDASRAVEGRFRPEIESLDLGQRVRELTERMRSELDEGEVRVEFSGTSDAIVAADRRYLETIVRNLLQNAAKYGGKGTVIRVRTGRNGRSGILEVSDNGPGLLDEDQERVFGRFYRVGDEMVRRVPGSGLGLYLSREMARALGGTITAESPGLGRGTTFRVALPLMEASR
jgi:signal transduction histidine kinase